MVDIENIIKNMTLKEKIAQLIQVNANVVELDASNNITGNAINLHLHDEDIFNIGSILNFGNINEVRKIQNHFIKNNKQQIKPLFMLDVIHGDRTIYPIPLGIGASFDEDLAYRLAKMAGKESRAEGVEVTFAPMVDLVRDARWGRCMESTGEDPYLNSIMGLAFVNGFQDDMKNTGIASCVKHFGCYGQAEAGKDYNTTDMSEYRLRNYYLKAYEYTLKNGANMVMSSFNSLNGNPCAGNKYLLKDILRDEWNYDGVLISDYSGIEEQLNHGVVQDTKECALRAIESTTDIEMMSSTYISHLEKLVNEKKIDEKLIDDACRRILILKDKLGLFENHNEIDDSIILSKENRLLAKEGAIKSCVLLKNDDVLPLSLNTKSLLVVGPTAIKGMNGNWSCHGNIKESISLLDGIKNIYKNHLYYSKGFEIDINSEDESLYEETKQYLDKVDTIIIALGEDEYMSGEGKSRANITISPAQLNLVKMLKQLNKKVVGIVYSGRPLALSNVEKYLDAIIEAWMPGTEGGNALAELLFGIENFEGKLPMSFPRSVGQCPIYYNHLNTGRPKPDDDHNYGYVSSYIDELNSPLYNFGYGLSYSKFEISKVTLNKHEMNKDNIIASVMVKNISNVKGVETIQLYIQDKVASLSRPVKELKGIQKVELKPNEEKEVSFIINEEMLKFYNIDNKFVAELGTFKIMIGNSANIIEGEEFILK